MTAEPRADSTTNPTPPVASALALHARGLHVFPADHPDHPECIGKHSPQFPCDGKRGKHPAVKWGVWAVTVTPQMIELEWRKHGGLANIAVACGPSGLVVLDEDEHGELERWCAAYGITLPPTYTVITARGRHLYYRWDHSVAPIGNSEKATKGCGFNIDVRGHGGYAIAEGSQHETGVIYTGNEHPVIELPEQAARILLAAVAPTNGQPHQDTGQFWEQHCGRDYDNDKIGFGDRHHALVAYAGRLRKSGLSLTEALPAFQQRWLLCEQPEEQIPEARYHSTDCPYSVTWTEAEAKLRDVFNRYAPGQNLNGAEVFTDPPAAPAGLMCVEDLEGDFWTARESLTRIYAAALARMCSPWALLANCAARALALVRPHATLPPLIGGPGSLNWFAAIAAPSGGGKGAAGQLSRLLVPSRVVERNLGSGEGMITAYIRYDEKGRPVDLYEAVMFTAAEIDTMTALGSRSGSTTMSVLREAFSGGTLGHAYVSRDKNRHLEAGTYRMTVVLSVQPCRAGGLLDDQHGGTPQRFQWFPGIDARITDTPPAWEPHPLTLPSADSWMMPFEIAIPDKARALILSERAAAMRGETPELDAHAPFAREKFAYALAVLDGRAEMNDKDWDLSGVAAAVSTHVRDWVAAQHAQAAEAEAARLGTLRGITNQVADDEKTFRESQRSGRIAAWIISQLTDAGAEGLSEGELRRRSTSRERSLVSHILGQLAKNKVVKHVSETGRWVVA